MRDTTTQLCSGYCEACAGGDQHPHRDSATARRVTNVDMTGAYGGYSNAVDAPKHYQFFPDLEAIVVIARSMTQEQFYGYCLGNRLKYRLRAGNKDKLEQDIAKSDKHVELYEQHKHLCVVL